MRAASAIFLYTVHDDLKGTCPPRTTCSPIARHTHGKAHKSASHTHATPTSHGKPHRLIATTATLSLPSQAPCNACTPQRSSGTPILIPPIRRPLHLPCGLGNAETGHPKFVRHPQAFRLVALTIALQHGASPCGLPLTAVSTCSVLLLLLGRWFRAPTLIKFKIIKITKIIEIETCIQICCSNVVQI